MRKLTVITITLALLLGLAAGIARAGSSAHYAVNWQVLAGGGGPVATGGVSLNGTLGQPVVGPAAGGGVTLGAGYWCGSSSRSAGFELYLPLILRMP